MSSSSNPSLVYAERNGQSLENPVSARDFLKTYPRGAYTTMRTVALKSIFQYNVHMTRLAQSVALMMESEEKKGAPRPTGEWVDQITRPEPLRALVGSALRGAVSRYCRLFDWERRFPEREEGARRISADGELKVVVLITWEAEQAKEAQLLVHLSPLNSPRDPPVKLLVRPAHRSNAVAKDSQWVREAAALEADKAADVEEIVLLGPDGTLLEGVTSNFFAVYSDAIWTAPSGVLEGTVRNLLLKTCQEKGVPVRLEAPPLSSASEWGGAFITSTSRLVLPADAVSWAGLKEMGVQGVPGADLAFREPYHPLLRRVKELVEEEFFNASQPY